MRSSSSLAALAFLVVTARPAAALASGGDGWPAMAHDATRTARSTGTGAIPAAPEVAWRRTMGGALSDNQVAVADVDGDGVNEVILVSAGRVVARRAGDTSVWSSANIGASRVVGVFDLDGHGKRQVVAVGASPFGLYILDAGSGATLWYEPTTTTALDVLVLPNPNGGQHLYLTQQLGPLIAYEFTSGITSPTADQIWQSSTSPWSTDLAAGDVDGDGTLEIVRGHDRGFVVYDAATGAVRCDAHTLVGTNIDTVYFPAFSTVDVNGDGRAEVVLFDYSYYYSEDAGVYVVSCTGSGPTLTPETLWNQVWINDTGAGAGTDVNKRQVVYFADGVASLDGQKTAEMVYSLWDAPSSTWTTMVADAATGNVLVARVGQVLEGVADIDGDGKPDVLLRDAVGIGALPAPLGIPSSSGYGALPFFSTVRAYDYSAGNLVDKGWSIPNGRAALVGGWRSANVTAGAGPVLARQGLDPSLGPAAEAYILQMRPNAAVSDPRPGSLLAVHGADGKVVDTYGYPDGISGSVLALTQGVATANAPAESLVMLNDGGLRLLDDHFGVAGTFQPGNHARLVTVASLSPGKNNVYAVDSSDTLVAVDGTLLDATGVPVTLWRVPQVAQGETRGYVNAPGLVLPQATGAALVVRGNSSASYEETALVAVEADGTTAWKTDVGAGLQIPSFENFELMDDLDGDGVRDIFLTQLDSTGAQQLVVRRGADGTTMVTRPVGDLFPPTGTYFQGHAAVDVNGDGKLDVVSALHVSWFVGVDVSKAAQGDPQTGFTQIFRSSAGANGQAIAGDLGAAPGLHLLRTASQNAFGPYERRSLAGVVEASYQPPTLAVAGSDANTAALVARPGAPGLFDLAWAGMAGDALGAVARVDGVTMTEVWFEYLAGGMVYPKSSPPSVRAALYEPIAVDVDGDGNDEVIVGADDGFLYALHATDGSLLWSVSLGAPVVHTIAADIDLDPQIELLSMLSDGTLVALDAPGAYVANHEPPDAGPPEAGPPPVDAGADDGPDLRLWGRACTCTWPGAPDAGTILGGAAVAFAIVLLRARRRPRR